MNLKLILSRLFAHELITIGLLLSLIGFFIPWMAYGDIARYSVSGAYASEYFSLSPLWGNIFILLISACLTVLALGDSYPRRKLLFILAAAIVNSAIVIYLFTQFMNAYQDVFDTSAQADWLFGQWVIGLGLALWIIGAVKDLIRLPKLEPKD
jgi:hypothetical protein